MIPVAIAILMFGLVAAAGSPRARGYDLRSRAVAAQEEAARAAARARELADEWSKSRS